MSVRTRRRSSELRLTRTHLFAIKLTETILAKIGDQLTSPEPSSHTSTRTLDLNVIEASAASKFVVIYINRVHYTQSGQIEATINFNHRSVACVFHVIQGAVGSVTSIRGRNMTWSGVARQQDGEFELISLVDRNNNSVLAESIISR